MIELVLLIPIAILGYLLWRADRRYDRDTDAAQKLLTATLDEWNKDRDKWVQERSQLLNRVQRPDMAVYENFEPNDKRHVPFDDDEAYWAAIETERDGG